MSAQSDARWATVLQWIAISRVQATTIQLMGRCFVFRWMRYDPYGSLTNWDYNND